MYNNIMNTSISEINTSSKEIMYSLGYKCIAVVDSEGVVIRTGGSNRTKYTTFLVRKISVTLYCMETDKIYKYHVFVKLPNLDQYDIILRSRVIKQWRYVQINIHGLEYICNSGLDINLAINNTLEFIKEYASYTESNKCLLLAKGKGLEERLLNNLGLQNKSIKMRTVNKDTLEYKIFDINCINAPKFDTLFEVKTIHDPEIETEFYLKYSLIHISKIIKILKYENGKTINY